MWLFNRPSELPSALSLLLLLPSLCMDWLLGRDWVCSSVWLHHNLHYTTNRKRKVSDWKSFHLCTRILILGDPRVHRDKRGMPAIKNYLISNLLKFKIYSLGNQFQHWHTCQELLARCDNRSLSLELHDKLDNRDQECPGFCWNLALAPPFSPRCNRIGNPWKFNFNSHLMSLIVHIFDYYLDSNGDGNWCDERQNQEISQSTHCEWPKIKYSVYLLELETKLNAGKIFGNKNREWSGTWGNLSQLLGTRGGGLKFE